MKYMENKKISLLQRLPGEIDEEDEEEGRVNVRSTLTTPMSTLNLSPALTLSIQPCTYTRTFTLTLSIAFPCSLRLNDDGVVG